jgi:hypothetical protein
MSYSYSARRINILTLTIGHVSVKTILAVEISFISLSGNNSCLIHRAVLRNLTVGGPLLNIWHGQRDGYELCTSNPATEIMIYIYFCIQ